MTKREIVLVVLLLVTAAGVGYYFLFFTPNTAARSQADAEISTLNSNIMAAQFSVSELEGYREQLKNSIAEYEASQKVTADLAADKDEIVALWRELEAAIPVAFDQPASIYDIQDIIYEHTRQVAVSYTDVLTPAPVPQEAESAEVELTEGEPAEGEAAGGEPAEVEATGGESAEVEAAGGESAEGAAVTEDPAAIDAAAAAPNAPAPVVEPAAIEVPDVAYTRTLHVLLNFAVSYRAMLDIVNRIEALENDNRTITYSYARAAADAVTYGGEYSVTLDVEFLLLTPEAVYHAND